MSYRGYFSPFHWLLVVGVSQRKAGCLPAGVNFQIDEGKSQALVIQTCDLKGCYAATTVSPELLGSMKSGKRLSVVFQNLNKENVNFAFVLSGFAEGYDKIN